MNTYTDIPSQLRSLGFRMTPQRLVILQLLQEADCHLTPTEIYRLGADQLPGLTETTVYRTLAFLVDQGLVMASYTGRGQLEYEFAGRLHHHLICKGCHRSREIDHQPLADLYHCLQDATGYQVDSMHVTFFGLCPSCKGDR
jgi:Fe2+ or Zn2+ uptake regulation protein